MIRLMLIVLLSGHLFSHAQITFQGAVRNEADEPIAGAHLTLQDRISITDLEGHFEFGSLSPGIYVLQVNALGYLNEIDTLVINGSLEKTVRLTEQTYDLHVVKLSASWIKPGQPFTYAQMNKEQISAQNFGRDMPYLLQNMPSTVVTSDAGTGIGYTGIRIRGSDPTRINVTIDGVPLNDAESQGVFWVDLPDLATNAGAIQVQRGVGTSTNGAGAFGATVNIKTAGLEHQSYAMVDLTGGSFNTLRANAKFGTGLLGEKLSFQGSISHIESDGYIDRASSDLNSIYLTGTLLGRNNSLKINFLRGKEVTYQAWNGVPFQYVGQPELRTYNTAGARPDGSFYDNEVDDYGQTHLHAIFHQKWNDLHLQTTVHYTKGAGFFEQYRSSDALADYGLDLNLTTDDLVRRRWLDNDYYGLIFNLNRSGLHSSWSLGGGANQYLGDHFGEVIWLASQGEITPRDYYRNDAIKNDLNFYGQYQYTLPGQWTLFADLQWRTVSYRFEGFGADLSVTDQKVRHHFFNPKLGIQKKIGALTAYYSAGIAHREPNRDDYVQSTPLSRPRPERLTDHELGARLQNRNLDMSLNLFFMDYKDQLVLTGAINDVGEYNRVNVAESYRTGLEYSLNWNWHPRLIGGGSFTWNRSRIKFLNESIDDWDTGQQWTKEHQDVPISFSPETVSSLYLDYKVLKTKRSDLRLRPDFRFVGMQFLDNTGDPQSALEGYHQTDFTILMNWFPRKLKQITFKCQVVNLLDRSIVSNGWVYRFRSSGYDPTADDPHARRLEGDTYTLSGFYPQAGIHLLAGAMIRF